jgi:threonine/homoserine/homoserine lactone efflux protein
MPMTAETLPLFAAGLVLGLSLAAPPGPVMAIMATASAQGRPRESVVTAMGAIVGDAVWLLFAIAGFVTVLRAHPRVIGGLGILGGAMLLWMAWQGFQSARRGIADSTLKGSFRLGFATVLSSPYSFAWWVASGPIVISTLRVPGIVGLFLSLVAYTVTFSYALSWLGARVKHAALVVAYVGVLVLSVFGVYFALEGIRLLRG